MYKKKVEAGSNKANLAATLRLLSTVLSNCMRARQPSVTDTSRINMQTLVLPYFQHKHMNLKFSFRSAFVIFLPLCWWLKENSLASVSHEVHMRAVLFSIAFDVTDVPH